MIYQPKNVIRSEEVCLALDRQRNILRVYPRNKIVDCFFQAFFPLDCALVEPLSTDLEMGPHLLRTPENLSPELRAIGQEDCRSYTCNENLEKNFWGECLQGEIAARSRYSGNTILALILELLDFTIDTVNDFTIYGRLR